MKILFVTSWYPGENQPHLGIFVREHARSVQHAGNQVLVLALTLYKSTGFFRRIRNSYTDSSGMQVIHIELHTILKDLLYHLPHLQYQFIKKHITADDKVDIVHSHVVYPAGIWGKKLADRLSVPHILTEHWSRLNDFSKSINFAEGRRAYADAAAILPVSQFLKKRILSVVPELPDDKFQVIGNVVDPTIFNYRQQNTDEITTLTFCAVATWQHKKIPDKLPELFIDALASLQQKLQVKLQVIIVGGGNRVDELKSRCLEKGLPSRFTGFLTKEEIAAQLQQSDFFVHASSIETFSIVVAEALACGVPVISSDTGALPELINEQNGILCNNTAEAWEKGISSALEKKFDRKEIATALSQRFGPSAIGNQINKVYQQQKLQY